MASIVCNQRIDEVCKMSLVFIGGMVVDGHFYRSVVTLIVA